MPGAEVCNLIDDNCDGRADEGLWTPLRTSGAHVFTQAAGSTADTWGQTALAPSADGGAWLVYAGRDIEDGDTRAAKLNSAGQPSGIEVSLGRMGFWTVDGRGAKLAVLYQASAIGSDTQAVYLRVFSAGPSQLVPLGDPLLVLENRDPDSSNGNNELVALPIGVSLLEDHSGALHVLTLASRNVTVGADSTFPTQLRVATLSGTNTWSAGPPVQLSQQNNGYFAGLAATAARVVRIPCRDEWLLVYAAELAMAVRDWRVVRVNLAAELIGNAKLDTFADINIFLAGLDALEDGTCDAEERVVLGFQGYPTTYLRRWAIDVASGALRREGTDIDLGVFLESLNTTLVGGKSFVSGVGRGAWLWEVAFDATAGQQLRPLDLRAAGGAYPGDVPGNGDGLQLNTNSPICSLGSGLLVAYPNGFDATSNLDNNRSDGDAKPAVAVTRVIGCP